MLPGGLYLHQDKVVAVQGRLPDDSRVDEMVMTRQAAEVLHAHVGQVLRWGFFSNAQSQDPAFGTPDFKPYLTEDVRLVGIVVFNTDVVQDDVDRLPTRAVFTPALTEKVVGVSSIASYALQLNGGAHDVPEVERAVQQRLPGGFNYNFHRTAVAEAKIEQAVEPESIALGVFGVIAAGAVLLIAGQGVSRQLQADDADRDVLRALGAGRSTVVLDSVLGVVVAIVTGSVLAGVVAVALSPLAPTGAVRAVLGHVGPAVDWTVIGLGVTGLVIVLVGLALWLAYRRAPHRLADRARLQAGRRSGAARLGAAAGLPPTGVVGLGFALDPGRARRQAPVRAALFGTALAVTMVTATLTFGASLRTRWSRTRTSTAGTGRSRSTRTTRFRPPRCASSTATPRSMAGRGTRSPTSRSTAWPYLLSWVPTTNP